MDKEHGGRITGVLNQQHALIVLLSVVLFYVYTLYSHIILLQ